MTMKKIILDASGGIDSVLDIASDDAGALEIDIPDDYPRFMDWDPVAQTFVEKTEAIDALLHDQIEAGFTIAVQSLISDLPGQTRRYDEKYKQAKTYRANPAIDPAQLPRLNLEAYLSSMSLADLVDEVEAVGDFWAGVDIVIEATRMAKKRAVTDAATLAEKEAAAAVDWDAVIAYAKANPVTIPPASQLPTFHITVEENSGLNANAAEWAHGNGANTPVNQGVVVPIDCELFATAASLKQGTAVIGIYINGQKVAEVSSDNAVNGDVRRCYRILETPVQVAAGSVIGFRTISASGTAGPNQASAWFNRK